MTFRNVITATKAHSHFPRFSGWVFIILFGIMAVVYDYQDILFKPPQSLHLWRQCDCLSLTQNYYQDNNAFFMPSVNNLGRDGTGRTVSDFPLIYYSVAQLWKIFGKHIFIYRLTVLLLFFCGLFALFRLFEKTLHDSFWAITMPLFLFTFPTLAYYAGNFLMDIPALSLAMIGLYFFFRFTQTSADKYLVISALFYLVAGLLKISSILSFLAIVALFMLEALNLDLFNHKRIFTHPLKQILVFAGVVFLLSSWIVYAHDYNSWYNSGDFLVGILPAWQMTHEEIQATLQALRQHLKWDYFRQETGIVYLLLFVIVTASFKKANRVLYFLLLFTFLGLVAYIILFFRALNFHDYYTINLDIIIPILALAFLTLLKDHYPRAFGSVLVKVLVVAFLIHNIDFARRRMNERYSPTGWQNREYMVNMKPYSEIGPTLDSLGINKDDKVLCLSDNSINNSLYFMDRKGWTNYGIEDDSPKIRDKINRGAKYLFINTGDTNRIKIPQYFLEKKIGTFKNIEIYFLLNPERQSNL